MLDGSETRQERRERRRQKQRERLSKHGLSLRPVYIDAALKRARQAQAQRAKRARRQPAQAETAGSTPARQRQGARPRRPPT